VRCSSAPASIQRVRASAQPAELGARCRQTETGHTPAAAATDQTELVVVDEADRLKMAGLEQVRDLYDQSQRGLVLLGMPGLERPLSRYPQLYSRVSFVHQFRTLGADEIRAVVTGHAEQLGVTLGPEAFADPLAVASIICASNGNFV